MDTWPVIPKGRRAENWSTEDQRTLIRIVNRYKDILENKKTLPGRSHIQSRIMAWAKINQEFNSTVRRSASAQQLRKAWDNIKRRHKKLTAGNKAKSLESGGSFALPASGDSDDISSPIPDPSTGPSRLSLLLNEAQLPNIKEVFTLPVKNKVVINDRNETVSYGGKLERLLNEAQPSNPKEFRTLSVVKNNDWINHFDKTPLYGRERERILTKLSSKPDSGFPPKLFENINKTIPPRGERERLFNEARSSKAKQVSAPSVNKNDLIDHFDKTPSSPKPEEVLPPKLKNKPNVYRTALPGGELEKLFNEARSSKAKQVSAPSVNNNDLINLMNKRHGRESDRQYEDDVLYSVGMEFIRSANKMAEEEHKWKREKNERKREENERRREENERRGEENERKREIHKMMMRKLELENALLEAQLGVNDSKIIIM